MRMAGIAAGLAWVACAAAQAETVTLQVQDAILAQDPHTAQEVVNVTLTPDGRQKLADFSHDRVGRMIHLRANGVLLTSATLRSPIEGGELQLSPGQTGFDGVSAGEIARRLNEGGALEVSDDR